MKKLLLTLITVGSLVGYTHMGQAAPFTTRDQVKTAMDAMNGYLRFLMPKGVSDANGARSYLLNHPTELKAFEDLYNKSLEYTQNGVYQAAGII